ncbi:MAG TPA: extracellular solute-binding protein, partial [Candidatus Binatus sp.]|nr:extracellular solute-binding protein [Candidatus Binatus sp.]
GLGVRSQEMKNRTCRLALLTVMGLLFARVAMSAQARWDDVVRGAEKEGDVTVYATNSVGDLQVIWDAFKKKFPKIKLNSVGISTTSEIVTKIMAERRASQYLVDVVLGAPGATYNSLQRGKALDPMPPALILPEVTDLSKWWKGKHRYVDPEGQYVFVYQSSLYGPPVYANTKLVNPDSIKSVWELLDARWKGKMISLWPRANYVSTAMLFMYHHPQVGPKFLDRLFGGEMDPTYFSDFRQGTDWLASGKYQLCILCRLRRAMEQGLPVVELNPYNFKEAPGIGSNNGAIGLLNSQPHANAARVFINWYLSREGQIAFRQANNTLEDETTTSMREDLPPEVVPEAARRKKNVDYIEISRHDWMEWKPVGDLITAARQRSGK